MRVFTQYRHGVPEAKAAVSFEGFLVELGEVKQIADGKAGSRGGRKVLSFMLADGGGMIQVNLWNDLVSKKQRTIETAFQDSQAFPRIRATNFEVIVLGRCGGKRLASRMLQLLTRSRSPPAQRVCQGLHGLKTRAKQTTLWLCQSSYWKWP